MEEYGLKQITTISLSFLLGLLLMILPLPTAIVAYRPQWVLMILLFWLIKVPHKVGVGVAFFIGLVVDLVMGTLLGEHALLFSGFAYLLIRFQNYVHGLPLWQLAMMVLVQVIIYNALRFWLLAVIGVAASSAYVWLPALTTVILWPLVYLLLSDLQARFFH